MPTEVVCGVAAEVSIVYSTLNKPNLVQEEAGRWVFKINYDPPVAVAYALKVRF